MKKILLLCIISLLLTGCSLKEKGKDILSEITPEVIDKIYTKNDNLGVADKPVEDKVEYVFVENEYPSYTGEAYTNIDWENSTTIKNKISKCFSLTETESSEYYSDLDTLGRCGACYAVIGKDIMPTEERGEIGNVRPSGWDYNKHSNNNKYPELIQDNPSYIYNRCHLIGYCLTGENDNTKNLITGTRYLNVTGMLDLETKVARYVESTGNHVAYYVEPIFNENELVCRGVLMFAYSIEDSGESINTCIYAHNVQPSIEINYLTGENWIK